LIEANSIKKNVFRIYRCQAIVLFQGNFDATHGHRFHDCFLPSTSVKLFHQAQFNSSAKLNSGFAKFWCQCNSNGVRKMCAASKNSWVDSLETKVTLPPVGQAGVDHNRLPVYGRRRSLTVRTWL
jgi:hypothetical protein